jgi:hypothetical protein
VPRPGGRLLLVDASGLHQPGGPGDDWRRHLAYDLMAGRMQQVGGTDRRGGEPLARSQGPAGVGIVADRGSGSRRRVAIAVRQQAEVGVRIPPATVPLDPEEGHPFHGLRGLRPRGGPEREWHGWCCGEGRRDPVRLVAATRTPAAAQPARRRPRRQAQKAGRTLTTPTRVVAGWLLVSTTRDAGTWSAADVL